MASTEEGERAEGAKIALQKLVKATVEMSHNAGLSLSELQGLAFYEPQKDEKILDLEAFGTAASKIVYLPRFVQRFGPDAGPRIALQFVYQYFERGHVMSYSEEGFESTHDDLIEELLSPAWVFRGVANVRHFTSDIHHVDLGDGITIRSMSP